MKLFTKSAIAMIAVCLLVVVTSPLAAQKLKADLTGYEEVPAVSTQATGSFKLTLNEESLEYELSYSGLEGDVLFAHIHLGQPAVSGGVIAFLCGGGGKEACPQSGTVKGTITPEDVIGPSAQGIAPGEFEEAVEAILSGVVYANVHSTKFPTGEIRGQVGPGFSNRQHLDRSGR